MRISTALSFQMNLAAMQDKQADLYHIQQQLATKRRIVTPSDDPVGAVHALQTSQALAMSKNNSDNIQAATLKVNQESVVLDAITTTLKSARNIVVGSQGQPNMQQRTDFANYLSQTYKNLLAYANTTDANGDYIFAGSKGSTIPFQQATGASNYQGDNAQQNISINRNRNIPVSDSGQSVFGVGTPDDPFAVIDQFITDLQNPALTGAAFDTAVTTAMTGLDNAMNTVASVHSQVAGRSQELTLAQATEASFTLQFQNELDRVESVDMQKAAVELQFQQTSLQASQQAYVNASKLTLFNYL